MAVPSSPIVCGPSPVNIEEIDCPICSSSERTVRYIGRDRLVGKPGEFPVVECRTCHLVYLCPRPVSSEIGFYYPDDYFPLGAGEESPEAISEACGLLQRVKRWNRKTGQVGGRILDLGCGTGLFLKMASDDGFHAQGVEISEPAANFAREIYGVPVECADILDVDLSAAHYDFVTMWHVLEHMYDPVAVLQKAYTLLRPGGLLLFAVPNIDSVESRIFGRRWFSLDVPRHLLHFSPDTATAAVNRAGFSLDHIDHSRSTAGLVYSMMGDLTGISQKLRGRELTESTWLRLARWLGALSGPACWLFARLDRGGAIEVYAIRPD